MRTNLLRFLLIRVACILLAVVSAQAEQWVTVPVDLDKLRGKELLQFMEAVVPEVYGGESRKPHDLSTLVRLHAHYVSNIRFLSEEPESKRAHNYTQRRLEAVMRNALTKVDLPALRRITLGNDKDDYGNGDLFRTLCHRWIEREVAQIRSEPKQELVFPEEAMPLPEYLRVFVPAGYDQMEYHRAVGPFAKLLADLSKQEPRGIHTGGDRFDELSRAFLLDRKKTIAAELLQFTWDSWCGTGAQEFEGTKMTLVFMGLLRERRIPEAIGVSFFVPSAPEWMREPGRPFDQWRIEILKHCGLDWEAAMLGSGRLECLAAAGSEKAARRALATFKEPGDPHAGELWYLENLIRFLIPGEPDPWGDADPRKMISAETQAEILTLLNRTLRDDLPFHELDRALNLFEELRRPETKEALRRLLAHPSTTYAERAATVLRSLREDIEPIEPAPPVRFRIFLNEQPWRSAELSYAFLDPKISHLGSGSIKTDAEGFAAIPRDEFLDPAKRGTRLGFRHYPHSTNVWSEDIYDQAWVSTEIPIPTAYGEITLVHFTAARVPFEISYGSPPTTVRLASAGIKLMRVGETGPNGLSFSLGFTNERVEVPSRFTLGAIEPGMYQLSVLVPGSARHMTEPFEVKAGMSPVKVKLEKGSDVYAAISVPDNARGAHKIQLFRGDKDVTSEYPPPDFGDRIKPLFSGVPKGSYQLRVLSTKEFMRENKIAEWSVPGATWQPDLWQGVDCEGLTIDFTIDETTSPLLDLGKLENKPVNSMRDKAMPAKLLTRGAPGQ